MTLKNQFAQDVETFLNLEEFSEIINLDGVHLNAVVTFSTKNNGYAQKPSSINKTNPLMHGRNLVGNLVIIYFSTAEYTAVKGRIPKHSEFVMYNGQRLKVEESIELAGITKLICASESMNVPRGILP